jgi:hypothetical protein
LICQTNPQNAVCSNPASPISFVDTVIERGTPSTFSVFLQAAGTVPPGAQVCVLFQEQPTGDLVQPRALFGNGQVCVPVVSS